MFANIGLSTMVIFNGGREVCDRFYRGVFMALQSQLPPVH